MSNQRTYLVELWDFEEQRWSPELARAHLDGPNTGLSWRGIGQAIRTLRGRGWSEITMYVKREQSE